MNTEEDVQGWTLKEPLQVVHPTPCLLSCYIVRLYLDTSVPLYSKESYPVHTGDLRNAIGFLQPVSVFVRVFSLHPHVTIGHCCRVWACVGTCVLVSEDRSHDVIENTQD